MRPDGREPHQLRSVTLRRDYTSNADGSVLVSFGDTRVLCTATIEERVPPFLRDARQGWVTAEYAMLPASASEGRISRDAVRKGRALEISRLIGRSLRAVVDLKSLGERQIIIDCDVIQADGGTRTAAITGGFVALHDAVTKLQGKSLLDTNPLTAQCAAVSLGIVNEIPCLDLNYKEDFAADVDLNLVMTSDNSIVELQATAEGRSFTKSELDEMLDMGARGIDQLFALQREALGIA